MVVLKVLLLDDLLEPCELLRRAAVRAEPLLEELLRGAASFELDKVHRALLVRLPACEFVDDAACEVNALA